MSRKKKKNGEAKETSPNHSFQLWKVKISEDEKKIFIFFKGVELD